MTEKIKQKLQDHGEETKIQLKERLTNKYAVGCEFVALSNSRGDGKTRTQTAGRDLNSGNIMRYMREWVFIH